MNEAQPNIKKKNNSIYYTSVNYITGSDWVIKSRTF